jgi:phosphotransferase system enzyme I (PtsI)
METRSGIAVSPGVAIGPALVLDSEGFRIARRFVSSEDVADELERLGRALEEVCGEIAQNQALFRAKLGEQYAAIFGAHVQIIRDPKLRRELEDLIRNRHFSCEYAVSRALREYAKVLQSLNSPRLADRASDIYDIEKRILRHLLGEQREHLSDLTEPVIVVAHNLTPSETANLDTEHILGFATEAGGRTSHTSIVAGALEIPAVVGLGHLLTDVSGGDTVILDGNHGEVILDPDAETLARYRDAGERMQHLTQRLSELRSLPAETKDGVRINLMGNIEFPHEVAHCIERGADGVGLYRTEFLYLGADQPPTEEEHFEEYSKVVRALNGLPVVIRTFDLGADKLNEPDDERNPVLGLRSIRLCLRNLPLFRTQLRAILRATALGDVRIMFPLISTLAELRAAKKVVEEAKDELRLAGIPFSENVPVGMMVEVPSAALLAERFAREVDFLSIGTNDLIQYTLAADRSNERVASLFSAGDPAVLELIAQVVEAARKQEVSVNVCGEMSGDPIFVILLLGMGLRRLSVTPHSIPEVKKIIRTVTIPQAEGVARQARTFENAGDVTAFLEAELRAILPEMVD